MVKSLIVEDNKVEGVVLENNEKSTQILLY